MQVISHYDNGIDRLANDASLDCVRLDQAERAETDSNETRLDEQGSAASLATLKGQGYSNRARTRPRGTGARPELHRDDGNTPRQLGTA